MTVEGSTDASITPPPLTWEAIDWPRVRQGVRRLQMRIAKATQAGQPRKAQALQWVLTHSRSAKLLAVHRVTTNRGAKTPGVDNVIWRTDRQKLQASLNLKRHGYRPRPLRRHYIPKPNGKLRPLSIPTLHDRAMQALYALALAPIAETLADRYSYGFREGRRCADALEQCFTILSQRTCAQWILEGDIRACFDEIDHPWLLQQVPTDKQLLRAWLKAGYWEKEQLFPTAKGTPQGGLISPLLANLALDGMERAVQAVAKAGDKVNFVRYADDFVVTGANPQLLEQKVKPALTAFLQQRGLELSEQKTVLTHIQTGFNFLGHTVRKYGEKLLITPAKSKVQSLRDKISRLIQSAAAFTQEALIRQLMSYVNSGAGPLDDTPANPKPGRNSNTSRRADRHGPLAYESSRTRARAACSNSTGWPALPSNAISKSAGRPTPTTHTTPNTSRSAAVSRGACVENRRRNRRWHSAQPVCIPTVARLLPVAVRLHRLERLEPYEGKLSSTVLRGGRAGNSPPLLDLLGVSCVAENEFEKMLRNLRLSINNDP